MKQILALVLSLLFLGGCAAGEQQTQMKYDRPVIALLDTGVSTAAIGGENLLEGPNYVTNTSDTEDRINHGTAVASVILGCDSAGVTGLAENACYLVPLVVADEGGSVTPEVLAAAIRESIDVYGADIINISLGIRKDAEAVRDAIAYAEQKNVLVVSAVGNDGESDELYYPAAYETVLAVGSHDKEGSVSRFSQQNGTADILAPGEDIWLASRNGKTYGARGTSYATGYVSAAAAKRLLSQPKLTAKELRESILSTTQPVDGWLILDMTALTAAQSSQ